MTDRQDFITHISAQFEGDALENCETLVDALAAVDAAGSANPATGQVTVTFTVQAASQGAAIERAGAVYRQAVAFSDLTRTSEPVVELDLD